MISKLNPHAAAQAAFVLNQLLLGLPEGEGDAEALGRFNNDPQSPERIAVARIFSAGLIAGMTIDPIIRVDRSKKAVYPKLMKRLLHPELESLGPIEYSAESIDRWPSEGEMDPGWTTGSNVYAMLREEDCKLLNTCLGLRDLEEIREKGTPFFQKYLKDGPVFGWRSVGLTNRNRLTVPCLCCGGCKPVLRWMVLDRGWIGLPVLRHTTV